jgi:hypothetical protein
MLEKLVESETGAGFCTPKVGINIKQYHNSTHIICAHIPPTSRHKISPQVFTPTFLQTRHKAEGPTDVTTFPMI